MLNAKLPTLCTTYADGLCGVFYSVETISPINCRDTSSKSYKYCPAYTINNSVSEDYWAGAAKLCGGSQNILTDDELNKISNQLLGKSCSTSETCTNRTYDFEKAASYGFKDLSSGYGNYCFWSNNISTSTSGFSRCISKQESINMNTGSRYTAYSSSVTNTGRNNPNYGVICRN